jgi:hypothetical protein
MIKSLYKQARLKKAFEWCLMRWRAMVLTFQKEPS